MAYCLNFLQKTIRLDFAILITYDGNFRAKYKKYY